MFDLFSYKYNPAGQPRLREIFLKTNNFIGGRFFAEVLKEVFQGLEESGCHAELRLSVHSTCTNEWMNLVEWVQTHNVHSDNVRHIVRVGSSDANQPAF